jgi:hypothetical protein
MSSLMSTRLSADRNMDEASDSFDHQVGTGQQAGRNIEPSLGAAFPCSAAATG